MAWRVQDHVVRGYLDNCTYGRVCGRIWLAGRTHPLIIDLTGNADASFAGCRLEFENRELARPIAQGAGLADIQRGTVEDMGCDRRIRVPLVPIEEFIARCEAGESPPETIANALHLEWESDVHGRILLESTQFNVRVSLPVWQLLPLLEEEPEEAENHFFVVPGDLDPDLALAERSMLGAGVEADWDEFDYERLLKARDASLERLEELIHDLDGVEDVWDDGDEGMEGGEGWLEADAEESLNDGVQPLDEGPYAGEGGGYGREPEPHLEGIEWIRTEDGEIRHPLAHRAAEWSLRALRDSAAICPPDHDPPEALREWRSGVVELATRLVGTLRQRAYGNDQSDPALTIALLKRTAATTDGLIGSTLRLGESGVFPEAAAVAHRDELFAIRQGVIDLIHRLRFE